MFLANLQTSPRFIRRPEIIREKVVGNLLDAGFAYSRSLIMSSAPDERLKRDFYPFRYLTGHTSCVNALAFSNGDGRFLASGGDGAELSSTAQKSSELKSLPCLPDLRIQLFDFQREDLNHPSWSFVGPTVCYLVRVSTLGRC